MYPHTQSPSSSARVLLAAGSRSTRPSRRLLDVVHHFHQFSIQQRSNCRQSSERPQRSLIEDSSPKLVALEQSCRFVWLCVCAWLCVAVCVAVCGLCVVVCGCCAVVVCGCCVVVVWLCVVSAWVCCVCCVCCVCVCACACACAVCCVCVGERPCMRMLVLGAFIVVAVVVCLFQCELRSAQLACRT